MGDESPVHLPKRLQSVVYAEGEYPCAQYFQPGIFESWNKCGKPVKCSGECLKYKPDKTGFISRKKAPWNIILNSCTYLHGDSFGSQGLGYAHFCDSCYKKRTPFLEKFRKKTDA